MAITRHQPKKHKTKGWMGLAAAHHTVVQIPNRDMFPDAETVLRLWNDLLHLFEGLTSFVESKDRLEHLPTRASMAMKTSHSSDGHRKTSSGASPISNTPHEGSSPVSLTMFHNHARCFDIGCMVKAGRSYENLDALPPLLVFP